MAHNTLARVEYSDNPPVCVFADSADALERMRRTAGAAGCRVAGVPRAGAAATLDCTPTAAALIELDGTAGEAEALALLDWAETEAAMRGRRILVSSTEALIDLVAARTPGGIAQLAGASEAERVAAVAIASRPAAPSLHDIGREEGPAILQQLSEDVGRIAAMLASLSEEEAAALVQVKPSEVPEQDESRVDATFVRALIRMRRMRDQYIRGGLFADPAWDMLLDLMAARLEGNRVAVSSLCIAAAVPATTALRWIRALTDRGLFIRSADPEDGRRVYIELSDDIARALMAYLRAVRRMAPA